MFQQKSSSWVGPTAERELAPQYNSSGEKMKDYREMSDEELRDLGVPKFTQLPGGAWIQNWCSEEDEMEFFSRNGNCFGFTSPQSRAVRLVERWPNREDPNQT